MDKGAFKNELMTGDAFKAWLTTANEQHQALMAKAGFLAKIAAGGQGHGTRDRSGPDGNAPPRSGRSSWPSPARWRWSAPS